MSDITARPSRPLEEIEQDFADLMASRLPATVARDKFERLWDETNAVAAQLVLTVQGAQYIALLKRMHETFECLYAETAARHMNGNRPR